MPEIIPALLVKSEQEFEHRLRQIENVCQTVQVDVLDGSLFGNISWHDARSVGALRTSVVYELHLMVENPLPIAAAWHALVPNLKRVIFHAEIARPHGLILEQLQEVMHLEAGLALNPETPIEAVHHLLYRLDQLTLLGVHPGFSGTAYLGEMVTEKVRQAHALRPDLPLSLDGGLTSELLPELLAAGVSRFAAASLIFKTPDPAARLIELQETISTMVK